MLRNLLCMLVLAVWSAICLPICLLIVLFTWSGDGTVWICRELWSPVLHWIAGAKLEIEGRENVDPSRPAIYAFNHQSTIDIPTAFRSVRVPFRFVAKSQLKFAPLIGWYLAAAGHVFIDRGHRGKAIASLEKAARKIAAGTSILLFPEGTRSPDGRILPFKKGPFALALAAKVPIVPVAIDGSAKLMPKNSWEITPGPIRVKIGTPIDPRAFAPHDREGLARAVRDAIIDLHLSIGGLGGDREAAIAVAGLEGVAARRKEKAA